MRATVGARRFQNASSSCRFTVLRNLTAYGGWLPVATMLERLGFQLLVEETLSIGGQTRAMAGYWFVLAMVLALFVGFSRLNHLRFLHREPMLTGIPSLDRRTWFFARRSLEYRTSALATLVRQWFSSFFITAFSRIHSATLRQSRRMGGGRLREILH